MESTIWTEKYRPDNFEAVKGQKEIVRTISAMVGKKNLPHLLFAGPPGCGKTTLSIIVAKKLFGEEWRRNFLELNASVTPDTPVMIRLKGKVHRTNFEKLDKMYFKNNVDKYAYPAGLEILSINKDNKTEFMPVKNISRHKAEEIAVIDYEGGSIKTSLNHSVIIFDNEGNLASIEASKLKEGDSLITFKSKLEGSRKEVSLADFYPQTHNLLRSGLVRNPRVDVTLDALSLDEESSWLMGLYLAEGCTCFNSKGSSGQTIFTLGFPNEMHIASKVANLANSKFGVSTSIALGASGFNRARESSIQVRLLNSQLSKFFKSSFYDAVKIKRAPSKRVPYFMFDASLDARISFLKGYMGDACGEWGKYVRYSSRSVENLIDIAWLGRITGLDSSFFKSEARLVWDMPSFSYLKTELLPSKVLINFINVAGKKLGFNARYALRHQLYSKKSGRLSKELASDFIKKVNISALHDNERRLLDNISKLVDSPLSAICIKKTRKERYDGLVYDVCVPGAEMFWGGTTPVLLHNSDDRGIDVVRNTIKDFARTKAIGDYAFKIIYLDECDSLTREAQQALRRTMENFVSSTRFILSCNYSSKIVDAIQSRCAVFKFKPVTEEELASLVQDICRTEKLKINDSAAKALVETSEGDVRKLVNILQSAASITNNVTEEIIYDLASYAKPKELKETLQAAADGKFAAARDKLLDIMLKHGLSGLDIIKQIQKEIWMLNITEQKKIELVDKCGEIEFRMVEGANEFIQLEALLANFVKNR